jgi:hypothetical protein
MKMSQKLKMSFMKKIQCNFYGRGIVAKHTS